MSQAESWMDEQQETTYADAEAPFTNLDVDPTALTRTKAESDIAGFARLAREQGERDRKRILVLAMAEGKALGQRAYYRLPFRQKDKATGNYVTRYVEGPTIQLSDALANIWGDLAIQIEESQLEGNKLRLTVRVVDLRSGTMQERPHFYTLSKAPAAFANNAESMSRWMAMQSQAAVSKAVRTTVIHALPDWLVQTAMRAAREASKVDASPKRVEGAIAWWATQGVSLEQLVELVGNPPERWTSDDLTNLRDLGKAMKDGEVSMEEAFGDTHGKAPQAAGGKPTGSEALGKTQRPVYDLEATQQSIRDSIAALGDKAQGSLKMLALPWGVPVERWPLTLEQLAQQARNLEGLAKRERQVAAEAAAKTQPQAAPETTEQPPMAPQAEDAERDALKRRIESYAERWGVERTCTVLGLDHKLWQPVASWRARNGTLAEMVKKLEAAEAGETSELLADLADLEGKLHPDRVGQIRVERGLPEYGELRGQRLEALGLYREALQAALKRMAGEA